MSTPTGKLPFGSVHRMDVFETRRTRLLELLATNSQALISLKTGIAASSISRMACDPREPHHKNIGEKTARKIELAMGKHRGWLDGLTEAGPKEEPLPSALSRRQPDELAQDQALGSMRPILAWEHEEDLPAGEFVLVPRLAVKLSAGNGHEQVEVEFIKPMPQAFRAHWIRERRLNPSKLAAMTASGNSMEPGIFHGDSLLVDTAQTEVLDGKVYALWYDGGERVKRLFRMPGGGLRINSDNPDFPSIELRQADLDHVRILGRVVLRSGEGGL